MVHDGLHDVFTDQPMGALTDQCNETNGFTRIEQDDCAVRSHRRAAAAWRDGLFVDAVVAVSVPGRHGGPRGECSQDEGIRPDTTAASLANLKPAFHREGTITAGSASPMSDGACAIVVMSRAKAEALGVRWLAEIGAHGVVAGPDSTLQSQPAKAITREGISVEQLDIVEINEALAAVALASVRELGCRPVQGQRQRRRDRSRSPHPNDRGAHRQRDAFHSESDTRTVDHSTAGGRKPEVVTVAVGRHDGGSRVQIAVDLDKQLGLKSLAALQHRGATVHASPVRRTTHASTRLVAASQYLKWQGCRYG